MKAQPPPTVPPETLRRLGMALSTHQRGEIDAAMALYRGILRDVPGCFDALHLLGVAAADRGSLDEGIGYIERALAIDASQPNALYSLARALMGKGEAATALVHLDRAVDLQENFPDAWFLRGNALQHLGQFEAAAASYERAVSQRPQFPEAFNNLAAALRALRNASRALECAERALALDPQYAKAFNNRGLILLDARRVAAAVDDFRRAIAIEPQFADAMHNLGTALMLWHRFAEAREAFAHLAVLAPSFRHVQGNLLHARLGCCEWTGFETAVETVTSAVAQGRHADVPLSFLCVSGSPVLQLRCARAYTRAHYPEITSHPPRRPRARESRIKIAYLSGDFGEHAVTYLLAGVLEGHDRERFETFALSWDRAGDGAPRRRVEAAVSRFIDVTATGDAGVARLMQELEVDIAVDLAGHTFGHRTGIFALRAAPVQVNYLGLPATMGAPYIDYLIADRFLIPEDQRVHYAEKVVWLPCFQPNDDRRVLAPDRRPRAAHGLPEHGLVFCCFNNVFKLNPLCFDVWMRLLRGVPGSVLWIAATTAAARTNLLREAAARGVDDSRLIFAEQLPYPEHLARYTHADLFLDTLPFNGGATASDALSMALPVLTCSGASFAARMAGSLLNRLGLTELVTESLADYESTAQRLASAPARLRTLRDQLIHARSEHPFFDTDRYRRQLENAYQTMWERHRAGLPPCPFAIEDERIN